MSKLKAFKEAIKNPPPERLAAIEYRSHLLQALGITFVSIMLIIKGFWYIIFAFIFGVGVSYTQGMTAYKKYKFIKEIQGEDDISTYEGITSYTRRRSKIIQLLFGAWLNYFIGFIVVVFAIYAIPTTWSRWWMMLAYPSLIFTMWFFLYFHVAYWIAYPYYLTKQKGGETNGKSKKRN